MASIIDELNRGSLRNGYTSRYSNNVILAIIIAHIQNFQGNQ